jgi:hypothetical protein
MVQLYSQTGGSAPSDTYPLLDTEIYQIFREYLRHEDGLANNRLSWMPTIHGFLYASYAFTIQTKIQEARTGRAIMGWIKEKTSAITLRMAMRKKGKRSRLTMNNFLLRL